MQQLTVYPIARGTCINFAATVASFGMENAAFEGPWVEDVPPFDLITHFSRWEPEVQSLIQVRTIPLRRMQGLI